MRYVASWAALSMVLELAWESAHVRLYTLWSDPDRWYVARAVLHCTLEDVAIGTIAWNAVAGVTMGAGLVVGLSNEDAARFAFLLATPIIGAAAALKLPELFGPEGNGVRGPALVGAICSAATAYLAVRFLMRYFETNRLTPFAIYCVVAGLACTIYFRI